VGHASEKPRTSVFLPDREESAAKVFYYIKLGVKVVPAGEKGTRFVVEEDQETDDKKKCNDGPDASKSFP